MTNNRIVVDLNKVQWAVFKYQNQFGHQRDTLLPKNCISYNGIVYHKDEQLMPTIHYPGETFVVRLARRGLSPDIWTPRVHLQLTANHSLTYTGNKAKSIYKEWCRRIYETNNKSRRKKS